uniref:HTH CENPB-type domain-containing protein n=1 Tax=Eucampia antarctica TaxID=49252 RepID=A0A7S2R705_9STRA|mmetsp:Transcript_18071/g.17430  ORF Transcript_18071/g.17430 Transcript_18071/m.17430 type:complete len:241 (+) Transcript_18071:128-850(+)
MSNSYDQNEKLCTLKLARKVSYNDVDKNDIHTAAPVVSSDKSSERRIRQTFTMSTKISWVKGYLSCPQGTNMRNWLERKNASENTRVSYTSFRRWNMTLHNMTHKDIMNCSSRLSKKISVRPHNEMEKVLIEFLRIRNYRLRASGRRKSTPVYIRAKAKEFYEEMYGDDSPLEFKASSGWLGRFQDAYRHLIDPDFSQQEDENKKNEKPSTYQDKDKTFKLGPSVIDNELSATYSYQDES